MSIFGTPTHVPLKSKSADDVITDDVINACLNHICCCPSYTTEHKYKCQWQQQWPMQVNGASWKRVWDRFSNGEGWAPTTLDSEEDHDFVRQAQNVLTNLEDYFIGGSLYPDWWWNIFAPFFGAFPNITPIR